MKRKFILLAMMLLTLIGGVNLNVLNAQEDVVTINGDATSYNHNYPIPFNSSYGLCQVTYTETEINHASGFISNIALKIDVDRERSDIAFYLQNTTETTLSTWIPFSDSDRVFYSNSFSTSEREDGWLSITLDNSFEYTGGNILLTVWDNSGSATYTYNNGCAYIGNSGRNSMLYKFDSNPVSTSSACTPSTRQPAIKFFFAEPADDIVPAAPTNLQAEIVDHQSINLTWDVAENASKYQVYQGENMIEETDQTEYLVEGLSDGTEYCFTVKSVRYNNTSDASDEVCAVTDELQVPATPANLTATNITHNSVTLTWDAVDYAESYTVSYTGGTITVTENTYVVTGLTPETDYTFSVTANNIKGSSSAAEVSATTLEYNDPFAGKLFRIKVMNGSYAGYYLNVNSHDITEPYYWYDPDDAATRVGVLAREESNRQIFTITDNGEGKYYLRDADGYLIKCDDKSNYKGRNTWDVDAYSTTVGTPLWFDYVDGEQFYIRDYDKYLGNGSTDNYSTTNNYFKVQDGLVYCDAPIDKYEGENHRVVLWSVEEVPFSAAAAAYNSTIFDDETTTLSVTTVAGSGNYTYSWSPANGLSDATGANPTFTPATTGEHTFTCTVTDTESGSTAEASVTVYVNARPALQLTVSADKGLIYNDDETAVLTATVTEGTGYAPYTYSWTLNGEAIEGATEATYTFSNTTVGEYTLTCTVTDARNNTQTASTTIEVKDASEKPLEIVLGTPINSTTYYPTSPLYGNSYSQQIYTASEINMSACEITSISFMKFNNTALSRNIKVFMLNVNKDSFTSNSDWVSVSDSDVVFDGSFDFAGNKGDWTTIELTNKFSYTGGDILLCVNDHTNDWRQDYPQFYAYSVDAYRSIMIRRDNTPYPDVMSGQAYAYEKNVNHIKLGYEIPAPKPENLVATPAQIHVGETTTLTWDAFEGAARYNIYVNGELKYNTTETSYELSGLTYNVEPGHTIEVAAVYEDETESGKASVTVQVAGTFTLTVNVTDGTNPIEGATVNIDMAYAYDEFKNQISPVTVEPTGADGKTTVELLRLPNEGFYNDNGNWVYPFYTVEVLKSPYQKQEKYINPGDVVTNGHTMDFVLALPTVSNIRVQDEEGENLNGDVMEGTNVVLSWDAVEGADSYKVYTINGEVESSETVTETTYTIEGVLKGYQYAVSALFGELESVKTEANLQVKGNGYFKGYVTDGTNALQGIQVKVSSEYGDASAVVTTDEEGYFNGEIMEGDNYKLTISHSDYEEYILENITIIYNNESDLETIQLTAKPSASGITEVTATLNGENVDVNWTVDEAYTKYNVYRRLAGTQGKGDNIAQDVAVTSYTDASWETLEPGTYQYGVSAFVEPQTQTRGTEVIFVEGFENNGTNIPTGWTKSGSAGVVNGNDYCNSGTYGCYLGGTTTNSTLTSPEIDLTSYSSATWSFYYWSDSDLSVKIKVKDGEWNLIQTYPYRTTFEKIEIALSEDYVGKVIQIQFEHKTAWTYTALDDILIVSESSEVETQIVWSDEVVKQGPATFIGGDTENPTAWNVDANWSTGSVPADGAEVTINANAVISSAVNVSNVTINAGTSLTVANGGALTVTGTISQASNYLLVLEEGGQIFQNNNNVTARFRMSIDNPTDWSDEANKDGWQFISMPFNDALYSDFAGTYNPSTGQNTCDYDLYKYDGSQDLEWLNYRENDWYEDKFMSGYGYLASRKEVSTVNMYGTLNVANPFAYRQYAYSAEKPLVNFHLVGNPFSHDINWTDFTISGTYFDSESGSVLENIQYFVDGYAIVDNNGNYQYYTSADNEPIKVGQGFFIKTLKNKVNLGYTPKRSAKSSSNNSLNITATGNAGKDNVIINLAGKSEGFDKLQNFNDAIATVYVAEDGKNYGIYNCDADVQEVELSFNANQMGNYTISIEPNGKFQTVTLVDRFTGIETNMLVEDYHFTAMSNVNTNRFIIKMVNGQQTTDNSHFVFQSGEDLIIDAEGTVQIIDVMGRVLVSDDVESTNNRINVSGFQNGTYMVRVINGSEVKVEKVVIY